MALVMRIASFLSLMSKEISVAVVAGLAFIDKATLVTGRL
ncbi:MAG: hypothetical protein ACI936_002035 [Paraglaciecola sp.]|jgi:hypothetical protein